MTSSRTLELIDEKIIPVNENTTLLNASLAAGIPHYHACGGNARCSTCRVFVVDGENNLTAPTKAELNLRDKKKFPPNIRLACQTKLKGNYAKIKRIIKDDVDAEIYVYRNKCEIFQTVGKEKKLVLFFLDIRNFTPFIEENLPFDVIHILRRLAVPFRSAILENNGRVIEAAGDGFYAVFGLDDNIKLAIKKAVDSAFKILNELKFFNDNYLAMFFNHKLEVGIGIHHGDVIVGTNGFAGENSLTVMGYPVTIASRLEQATKELNNNFIISEETFNYLDLPGSYPSMEINVKGVSNKIAVRLLGDYYN